MTDVPGVEAEAKTGGSNLNSHRTSDVKTWHGLGGDAVVPPRLSWEDKGAPADTKSTTSQSLGPILALVWLWCGLGVALVWPWCGFGVALDRKSTRLNSSHANISYAV